MYIHEHSILNKKLSRKGINTLLIKVYLKKIERLQSGFQTDRISIRGH